VSEVSRTLNAQPDGFRLPESFGLAPETEQEVRDEAWSMVTRGEADPDEFVEWATDEEILDTPLDEATAEKIWELVLSTRRAQQDSWGEEPRTALTAAFDELDELGVVARQNFSCCGTCASGEIWDERPEGRPSRGYVYFHSQDTDQLLESNDTYIGYGAFPDAYISEADWNALDEKSRDAFYEKTVTGLMEDVVFPVFERHGIGVSWNRRLDTRILLENVEYYQPV
jgi:hypothetical protein